MPPPSSRGSRRSSGHGKSAHPLLFALLAILLVCMVLAGGWLKVRAYLAGEAFRKLLSDKTSAVLHVEGAYRPLRWSGTAAYSDGYQARGSGPLAEIDASMIRANLEMGALLDRVWRVSEVEVARLDARFAAGAGFPASGPAASGPPSGSAGGWMPTRFELGELVAREANLSWAGAHAIALKKTRLSLRPVSGGWDFRAQGGTFDTRMLTDWTIHEARARLRGGTLYLTETRLRKDDGNLAVTGEIALSSDTASRLQFEADGLDVGLFLPPPWDRRLAGRLHGRADLVASGKPPRVEGTLSMPEATLEGVPMQKWIAKFTRTPQFEKLVLQTAEADFLWDGGQLDIRRLLLESEGLLRVEGSARVAGGRIEGTLQVGVSPSSLRWIPGAQTRVFTEARGAYVWTPVKLSGPIETPVEDLTPRLSAAVEGEVIDAVGGAVEGVGGAVKGGAKGILDIFLPNQ